MVETGKSYIKPGIAQEAEQIRKAVADPAEFRPVYNTYFKEIFRFIYKRVGDKELTADLTQQVFLNALQHLGKYQFKGAPFVSWLYRIASNLCMDFFRKSKRVRHVVIEEASLESLVDELTSDQTMEEWHQRLPVILEKLSESELQLIELRFFEAKPFKEVAVILDITETNAKVRTYRVLDKMKKLFLER
ncbi:MAG: sigma-70 family RNA polymerase sigma factor [Cyclobacteriaceae bacterium]|nr:sigma-70 family RNA polymerase sigma factor [Cyclobacteriaceae bacterium]